MMPADFHFENEELIRSEELKLINPDFKYWNMEAWSEIIAVLKLGKNDYVSILFPTTRN
jgi:hypothetical protein